MDDINVKQDEIRSTREVVRELGGILSQLETGAVAKIVIMSGSNMRGVILSVAEYARLADRAGVSGRLGEVARSSEQDPPGTGPFGF